MNKVGTHIIDTLIIINNDVNVFLKKISDSILDIQMESASIQDVIKLIDQIAQQTNLLSLNALIEAAKLGDERSGFSVIANEIRKLSDNTKIENKNIENRLQIISSKVNELTNHSSEFIELMKEENVNINETQKIFKELSSLILNMNSSSDIIGGKLTEISKNKEKVLVMTESNANLAEEFSANIEEITASIEENLSSSESNLNNVKKLKNISNALSNMIQKFKV